MAAKRTAAKRTGKFLGMPYDLRRPTRERARQRLWNVKERRLFVPKVFGWGYDVNFAELARLLRLR